MIIDNRYYRIKSIFGYRLRALVVVGIGDSRSWIGNISGLAVLAQHSLGIWIFKGVQHYYLHMQGDSVNVLRIDFLMQALTCISFVYPLIKLLESGEHYGQQLKRWIFRGGTPHPPKDLLFSYPECIAVVWRWVVVAGSDGWVANQHTDNCCCPILLNPLICIVLPSYPLH